MSKMNVICFSAYTCKQSLEDVRDCKSVREFRDIYINSNLMYTLN